MALNQVARADDEVVKRIADTKTVTIGERDNSAPLSFVGADGNVQGFSIDICTKIAAAAQRDLKLDKVDVKFVPVTAQTRVPLITAGTVDIICESITDTFSREAQVSFSNTYFLTGTKLLVRKDSGIKGIADLAGKTIVSIAGSTNERAAQAAADRAGIKLKTDIVKVKEHAQAMLNMEQGRADAFASDEVVLYAVKAQSKDPSQWEIVGDYLSYDPYGLMIPRNNDAWRLIANREIGRLIKSGEMDALYKKWFEPGPTNIDLPMSDLLKTNYKLIDFPE